MSKKPALTESKVIHRIWHEWAKMKCRLSCPNGFIYSWESDLLIASKSGYVTEYEVKLSLADFRNDAKKRGHFNHNETKYESLVNGRGPNRFVYVMPRDIVPVEEIPEWAGIAIIGENHFSDGTSTTCVSLLRNPKWLHKSKVQDCLIDKMNTCLYYKVFNRMK